jgi:hypothetical protein
MSTRSLSWWFPVALVAGVSLVEGALHLGARGARSSAAARPPITCKSAELSMDVDGDGRADRVRLEKVGDDAWANVYLRDGDGRWTLRSTTRVGEWSDDPPSDVLEAIDVNGDGRMDLVRRWKKHGVVWAQVFVSSGDAFDEGWHGPVGGVCLAMR